jgi:hypothetical protein
MEKGYTLKSIRAKKGAYDTIDNVTKFALSDDDYEEVEEWVPYSDFEILSGQIAQLKKKLTETDYIVIKIMEGVATPEDYPGILDQREQWRMEINNLEAALALIEE